jgi:hypothetical protein
MMSDSTNIAGGSSMLVETRTSSPAGGPPRLVRPCGDGLRIAPHIYRVGRPSS